MNAKERALEIYKQHIALATSDGRLFRKTVMDQLMAETGCSLAAAATHYNNAKKANPAIEGLGRAAVPKGVRKAGTTKAKPGANIIDDNECFSVFELVPNDTNFTVARYRSFTMQGDASEHFDEKVEAWPACHWVMIKGLGPNCGDNFRLTAGESQVKRYNPNKEEAIPDVEIVAAEETTEEDEDDETVPA